MRPAQLPASLPPPASQVDSEELQAVQRRLLEVLLREQPAALYPAAMCTLADLLEVSVQDALDAALERGDAAEVSRLLARQPGDAQDLFERALALAQSSSAAAAPVSAAAPAGAADAAAPTALEPAPQQPQEQQQQQGGAPQSAACNGGLAAAVQQAAGAAAAVPGSCKQFYVFS